MNGGEMLVRSVMSVAGIDPDKLQSKIIPMIGEIETSIVTVKGFDDRLKKIEHNLEIQSSLLNLIAERLKISPIYEMVPTDPPSNGLVQVPVNA